MSTGAHHSEDRRLKFYDNLVSFISSQLEEYDLKKDGAEAVANALADHLADYWGGHYFSFPKEHRRALSKRDMEVYRRYQGSSNHAELAESLGISSRALYKLIRRVRSRLAQQAKDQPPSAQLFEV